MTDLLSIAGQYGIVGLVLLGAGWWVIQREKSHDTRIENILNGDREERKELTGALQTQHSEALEQSKKSTEVLEKNTSVLSELSTIIKSR